MIAPYRPLTALKEGRWFKLICGASYQDLPAIRSLALAYALAGADCIDIAADPAVLAVVQDALQVAGDLAPQFFPFPDRDADAPSPVCATDGADIAATGLASYHRPWIMVSLNDGEDPHFRKAYFDPLRCPADCPRPCEVICPADAIAPTGVVDHRCYGCGRCFPVCPLQIIHPRAFTADADQVAAAVLPAVDAVEIHTQVGHRDAFERLWQSIRPHLSHLKLLAISCPYGPGVVDYLWALYRLMGPLPLPCLWQADGRPMSGDIGAGTTHLALRYGQTLLEQGPPGFVQLAGGTNHHTATKLQEMAWPTAAAADATDAVSPVPMDPYSRDRPTFGGVAYGSAARRRLAPLLSDLGSIAGRDRGTGEVPLEQEPERLWGAVHQARGLVLPLKAIAPRRAPLPRAAARVPPRPY